MLIRLLDFELNRHGLIAFRSDHRRVITIFEIDLCIGSIVSTGDHYNGFHIIVIDRYVKDDLAFLRFDIRKSQSILRSGSHKTLSGINRFLIHGDFYIDRTFRQLKTHLFVIDDYVLFFSVCRNQFDLRAIVVLQVFKDKRTGGSGDPDRI